MNLADDAWAFLAGHLPKMESGAILNSAYVKALLEERAALLAAVHDLQQEGTASEYWAGREREACAEIAESAFGTKYNEITKAIRARGPLRPPLAADRLAERVARLRAALLQCVEVLRWADGGQPGLQALEAARQALAEGE